MQTFLRLTGAAVLCLAAIAGAMACTESGAAVAEIKLPTMQCESCSMTITKALEEVDGVEEVTVDLTTKKATVVYVTEKTSLKGLEQAVANAGYDANETMRDTVKYAGLPACCRLPVE